MSGIRVLTDWLTETDEDGMMRPYVNLLSKSKALIQDMGWRPTDKAASHPILQLVSLPGASVGGINVPVPASKPEFASKVEVPILLQAEAEIDTRFGHLSGDVVSQQARKTPLYMEALGQLLSKIFFYGNPALGSGEFEGLATRMNSKSGANSQNVVSAGGTGSDNTSIFLCVWGESKGYGIFNKNSSAGFKAEYMGVHKEKTSEGTMWKHHWTYHWNAGLAIEDWRCFARLGDIDVSDALGSNAARTKIRKGMGSLIDAVEGLETGKACFYMNRTARKALRFERFDASAAAGMTQNDADPRPAYEFEGVPIRLDDDILTTESPMEA